MWTILQKINKNLIIAIPVMMVLGFGTGMAFATASLKQLIIPFTILMVYPMMVTLKIRKVFEGGDLKAQLVTQVINFGIVPFLTFGLGRLFFKDQPYMALGLLLAGLVPTSGMTISWTGFARGNLEAAVKMTVIGLTLGTLATPFYVQFLMGANLEVNVLAVMKQIVIIVFIPMIAGFVTQQALIRRFGMKAFQQGWAPRFPGLSTVGVLGIVFIAMSLKARAIAGSPQLLLYILAPLALLYVINFLLSSIVGKMFLNRGDAIALVYGSVMRNLSIALAISLNAFGPEGSSAALVIAAAYIIQVQSAAWYVRFTDRIFGPKEPEPAAAPAAVRPQPAEPAPEPAAAPVCGADAESLICDIRKILYATDMSHTASHAIRYACSIGGKFGAQVTVLHVVPDVFEEFSQNAGVDFAHHFGRRKWREFNEKGLKIARETVRRRVQATYDAVMKTRPFCPLSAEDIRVEVGDPVRSIVRIAEDEGYDMVIMGARGHSGLEQSFVGSVAHGVIGKCSKPVLVVRLPDEAAENLKQ